MAANNNPPPLWKVRQLNDLAAAWGIVWPDRTKTPAQQAAAQQEAAAAVARQAAAAAAQQAAAAAAAQRAAAAAEEERMRQAAAAVLQEQYRRAATEEQSQAARAAEQQQQLAAAAATQAAAAAAANAAAQDAARLAAEQEATRSAAALQAAQQEAVRTAAAAAATQGQTWYAALPPGDVRALDALPLDGTQQAVIAGLVRLGAPPSAMTSTLREGNAWGTVAYLAMFLIPRTSEAPGEHRDGAASAGSPATHPSAVEECARALQDQIRTAAAGPTTASAPGTHASTAAQQDRTPGLSDPAALGLGPGGIWGAGSLPGSSAADPLALLAPQQTETLHQAVQEQLKCALSTAGLTGMVRALSAPSVPGKPTYALVDDKVVRLGESARLDWPTDGIFFNPEMLRLEPHESVAQEWAEILQTVFLIGDEDFAPQQLDYTLLTSPGPAGDRARIKGSVQRKLEALVDRQWERGILKKCGWDGHVSRYPLSKKQVEAITQDKKLERARGKRQAPDPDTCHICGGADHWARDCPEGGSHRRKRNRKGGRGSHGANHGGRRDPADLAEQPQQQTPATWPPPVLLPLFERQRWWRKEAIGPVAIALCDEGIPGALADLHSRAEWEQATDANFVGRSHFGQQLTSTLVASMLARSATLSDPEAAPLSAMPADVAAHGGLAGVTFTGGKGRPIAGRLRDAQWSRQWATWGDPEMAQCLANGVPWRSDLAELAPAFFVNCRSIDRYAQQTRDEVSSLWAMRAVGVYNATMVAKYGYPRVIAPLHMEEQAGKLRLCFDSRYTNKCDGSGKVHFSSLDDIRRTMLKHELFSKIDVRSGYHHIAVPEADAPWLCFSLDGVIYYWHCVMFGMRSAPRWFMRMTAVIVAVLRVVLGCPLIVYIDDFVLFLGDDPGHAQRCWEAAWAILLAFGLVVAVDKACPPAPRIEALGLALDSTLLRIELSAARAGKLRTGASAVLAQQAGAYVPARALARLAGHLCLSSAGLWYGRRLAQPLYDLLRPLDSEALCVVRVALSQRAREACALLLLHWEWLLGRDVHEAEPALSLVTDSTLRQWAATLVQPSEAPRGTDPRTGRAVAMLWASDDDRIIAVKKAWAVVLGARALAPDVCCTPLSIRVDNIVAMYYLAKGGGRVAQLADAAWELTTWLLSRHVRLTGVHWIPSACNAWADKLSREDLDAEYSVTEGTWAAFLQFCEHRQLPAPTLDGMATVESRRVARFIPRFWSPHPSAVGQDFFATGVSSAEVLWLFPPGGLWDRTAESVRARGLRAYIASVGLLPVHPRMLMLWRAPHWQLRLAGWAPCTIKNYAAGMRFFERWYETNMGPLTVELLERFFIDCFDGGVRYETVNPVRSWLRLCDRVLGITRERSVAAHQRIKELLRGYRNISMAQHFARTWPITGERARVACTTAKGEAMATVITIGYAFLLRWSEAADIWKGRGRVARGPRGYTLYLDRSKTDVLAQGTSTFFPFESLSGEWLSRVEWALARIRALAPLAADVNGHLKAVLGQQARFHGLRHGRCSDLLAANTPKSELQELGRWHSVKAMTLYCHAESIEQQHMPEA
eukprot:m51a1_g10869 hypothetical protein (1566) ;mRNA; f:22531-27955